MPIGSAVRPARRDDMLRVWELIEELAEYERLRHSVTGSSEKLARYALDERLVDVFVIEEEGLVVGYTISFATFSTFLAQPGIWLEDIYVTPASRGRGLGRALLDNILQLAARRGCGRVEWSVLDWNEPAMAFYRSMGADVLPDWRICRVTPRSPDQE